MSSCYSFLKPYNDSSLFCLSYKVLTEFHMVGPFLPLCFLSCCTPPHLLCCGHTSLPAVPVPAEGLYIGTSFCRNLPLRFGPSPLWGCYFNVTFPRGLARGTLVNIRTCPTPPSRLLCLLVYWIFLYTTIAFLFIIINNFIYYVYLYCLLL